ncbi:GAF and ANTAR domain-containing protein [Amycolatopsis sp. CA-128772]|uniref:GAF and ANTAR domain-containing protein n=1 Tax=Amycolatopsis sp. CA-128772 TaxID=2073159 RepID=UPI001E32271F|nr:GAF and ANTAR domain-containing protein [Amycolatopsis sp. CA-128772]
MTRPEDVTESVQHLLSAVLASLRESGTALNPLIRVCQACVSLLPVDGASISVMLGTQHRQNLYASDAVVEHLEEMQFSLGEGPCFEAFDTGRPVLVPDLAQRADHTWPVFAAEIPTEQVGAIFAFPLRRGAARFGAMDMYRRTPGWLSPTELATALQITDIATSALLAVSTTGVDGEISAEWLAELVRDRTVVHQATGIVVAEFAISAEQALARLRGYAFVAGRQIQAVAEDLVAGRLHPSVIDE